MAEILDCKVSTLPMKYLGLPLGASYKSKAKRTDFGEDGEKVSRLKEVLFIKERQNHFDKEHSI